MEKYRWDNPGDWFAWKINQWSADQLRDAFRALTLDSDTIQDAFQSDMDEDGYFEELNE